MTKKTLLWVAAIFVLSALPAFSQSSFKNEQLRYPRVRDAFSSKRADIKLLLDQFQLSPTSLQLFIRVFKNEQLLEVWGKDAEHRSFQKLVIYPFCTTSGLLGPKRKQGDYQIPEGFYHINVFNPSSSFHLSLGINYPNHSDQILGEQPLGGDIFVHGNCVSIGCIPITDEKIKELYCLAVEAVNNGQSKIPVHIFPFHFEKTPIKQILQKNPEFAQHETFWQNLQPGFAQFEQTKMLPKQISINKNGQYQFLSADHENTGKQ